MEEERTEDELELETMEVENDIVGADVPNTPAVVLDPKQLASRKLAHEIKVARFLAGGEF